MILLGQVMKRLINSERILIVDANGQELYKGYVANFEHNAEDNVKPVKKIGMETKIFKRGNFRERIPQPQKEPVMAEDLAFYQLSELEFVIYLKIMLENK